MKTASKRKPLKHDVDQITDGIVRYIAFKLDLKWPRDLYVHAQSIDEFITRSVRLHSTMFSRRDKVQLTQQLQDRYCGHFPKDNLRSANAVANDFEALLKAHLQCRFGLYRVMDTSVRIMLGT